MKEEKFGGDVSSQEGAESKGIEYQLVENREGEHENIGIVNVFTLESDGE